MIQIYGLKNCDTCRKALKAIVATGRDAELIDVRNTPLSQSEVEDLFSQFAEALVNTRSTTWRGFSPDERALDPIELLMAHPSLMKRPVIKDGVKTTLGWTKDVQAAFAS